MTFTKLSLDIFLLLGTSGFCFSLWLFLAFVLRALIMTMICVYWGAAVVAAAVDLIESNLSAKSKQMI